MPVPSSRNGPTTPPAERIDHAVGSLIPATAPVVLAVSGGVDSMVLLHAAVRASSVEQRDRLTVATFDHGTGPAATRAVRLVRERAAQLGVRCVAGAAHEARRGEAEWRAARWRFLREVAAGAGATIATAHTRDDHLETIVMRILRGAGARGISALRAPTQVLRPLLDVSRADVEAYARAHGIEWREDPTNADPAFLRNRVRRELLPAFRSATPSLDEELLALADRAAALRRSCTAAVTPIVVESVVGRVVARRVADASWGERERALLCQTLAERAGIVLDWRGTERLAHFLVDGRVGTRIPLSGGFEAVLRRDTVELRRSLDASPRRAPLAPSGATAFGAWNFRAIAALHVSGQPCDVVDDRDPWRAWLPADATLEVRPWQPGDRMNATGSGPRRVKRFLSDMRVAAADRPGWPVVVANGEIVWIPGVRRARAATARSGWPRICIVCERVDC